tara:strand:- start:418 stop:639 length:222 start_codon:yes stop_codon:yes gene_type:complete
MRVNVEISEAEHNEMEWWLRHHKSNVQYLAKRIKKLVEDPEDEDYKEFFYNHFKATVDDFLSTVGVPKSESGE